MVTPLPQRLIRTASYWSERGVSIPAGREHWEGHPLVRSAASAKRGGLEMLPWLRSQLPPSIPRAVGLGVGAAAAELDLLRSGGVGHFDVYDASEALLENGRAVAANEGLEHRFKAHVADINSIVLEPESCELITFVSSLHHVSDLETVLRTCYSALKPGGALFAHEYIGPDRFAFPPQHVELARIIYRTIDPVLKVPHPELPVPNPVDVRAADPTEAVRSSEIPTLLSAVFPSVRTVSYDVALTIILWYGLDHNALYDTAIGNDLVAWLLQADEALVQSGKLPTYQATFLATKLDV